MLSLLYVVSMAVSFTNMFNGELTPFYIKYIVAILWIVLWLFDFGIVKKRLLVRYRRVLFQICVPYILIAVWSCVVWIIDRPAVFNSQFVTRMISNVLYILITYTTAMVGIYFFKSRAVKLSVIAMFLSTIVNLGYVVAEYGIGMFLTYIPHIFSTTDYEWGSSLYNFSLALEVQDITMASGFYLIYYLIISKEEFKRRVPYIAILLVCAVIGFKRTTLVGLVIACVIMWLIKKRNISLVNVIYLVSGVFIVITFAYIWIIKSGILADLTLLFNIDANGRVYIYNILSSYYEIWPFYLGKGFAYVDKIMYESTGFAAHSVIVRMFAEIGFIPFFAWIIHYLIAIPKRMTLVYDSYSGRMVYLAVIYMFTIFFMENTMTLFCIQYSFALFAMLPSCLQTESITKQDKDLTRVKSI